MQTLSVAASPTILFVDLSRERRSAERHQRARRSLRAGHGGDRRRPGQRRPPLSRPRRQRHPGLSAEALLGRPAARRLRQCADDHLRPAADGIGEREAQRHGRRDRRPRRRRRLDRRDLARLADGRQGRPLDRPARPRRPFRHRRAGARPRAGPRPHRRDRESEPHRRPVHRARDGAGERQALRALGRGADQPVDDDRRLGLLPAAGGDPPRLRGHGDRPAAQHDGAVPAPAQRRPRRHRRGRVHPRRHPRRDPHPVLAQGQCAAGPGDRGRQPGPDRRSRR